MMKDVTNYDFDCLEALRDIGNSDFVARYKTYLNFVYLQIGLL